MNVNGWSKDDYRLFNELLIKANRLQLNQIRILLDLEFDKRNEVLRLQKEEKNNGSEQT